MHPISSLPSALAALLFLSRITAIRTSSWQGGRISTSSGTGVINVFSPMMYLHVRSLAKCSLNILSKFHFHLDSLTHRI